MCDVTWVFLLHLNENFLTNVFWLKWMTSAASRRFHSTVEENCGQGGRLTVTRSYARPGRCAVKVGEHHSVASTQAWSVDGEHICLLFFLHLVVLCSCAKIRCRSNYWGNAFYVRMVFLWVCVCVLFKRQEKKTALVWKWRMCMHVCVWPGGTRNTSMVCAVWSWLRPLPSVCVCVLPVRVDW